MDICHFNPKLCRRHSVKSGRKIDFKKRKKRKIQIKFDSPSKSRGSVPLRASDSSNSFILGISNVVASVKPFTVIPAPYRPVTKLNSVRHSPLLEKLGAKTRTVQSQRLSDERPILRINVHVYNVYAIKKWQCQWYDWMNAWNAWFKLSNEKLIWSRGNHQNCHSHKCHLLDYRWYDIIRNKRSNINAWRDEHVNVP